LLIIAEEKFANNREAIAELRQENDKLITNKFEVEDLTSKNRR